MPSAPSRISLRHVFGLADPGVAGVGRGVLVVGARSPGESARRAFGTHRLRVVRTVPQGGETPLDPNAFISPQRIDADLRALSQRFDCVRTYSQGQGLSAVPEIASAMA
jgi:hypothetical protein